MKFFTSRIFFILIGALVLLSISAFLWWGITITKVSYTGAAQEDPVLFAKVQQCVGSLEGNTFFTVNEKILTDQIKNCDPRVVTASVQKSFPQQIILTYTTIKPIIAHYTQDRSTCLLVESFAIIRSVGTDLCLLYQIPEIQGKVSAENKFMLSYVAEVVDYLALDRVQVNKITAQGDATITYYDLQLSNKKRLLFPDGANVKQKVATALAAIKGLEEAKEGYSVIDVRFDRVVYR